MSDELNEEKTTKRAGKMVYDNELKTMAFCLEALDELDADARLRVIAWVRSKVEGDLPVPPY